LLNTSFLSISACSNCAPKRGRYSAFPSRFVCIAPRTFLSNASSVGDWIHHCGKNRFIPYLWRRGS